MLGGVKLLWVAEARSLKGPAGALASCHWYCKVPVLLPVALMAWVPPTHCVILWGSAEILTEGSVMTLATSEIAAGQPGLEEETSTLKNWALVLLPGLKVLEVAPPRSVQGPLAAVADCHW